MDWYAVQSGGDDVLELEACSLGTASLRGTRVDVYLPGGAVGATLETPACEPRVLRLPVGRGTYFIRVAPLARAAGSYLLRAGLSRDIDPDGASSPWYLAGDERVDVVLATRFETATDEDWYAFDAGEGRKVAVETWGLDPGVETAIEVFPPAGSFYDTIIREGVVLGVGHWMLRNEGGGFEAGAARLSFVAPIPGRYRVRVVNQSGTVGGYRVAYTNTGLTACCYPPFP